MGLSCCRLSTLARGIEQIRMHVLNCSYMLHLLQAADSDIGSILHELHETCIDPDLDTHSVVTSKSLHGLKLRKKEKRKLRHAVWTKSM